MNDLYGRKWKLFLFIYICLYLFACFCLLRWREKQKNDKNHKGEANNHIGTRIYCKFDGSGQS